MNSFFVLSAVICFWFAFSLVESTTTNTMVLQLLSNAQEWNAACLDGTTPGYYIRKSATGSNNWMISLIGGGWCYSIEDCYARSKTFLGSNKYWPQTSEGTAILSANSSVNPTFWDWNMVNVIYCDGASYSGNRDEPLFYNNTNLYMRGHSILDATMDELTTKYGLNTADSVVLTGCSAGGLSTYLHADYVREKWISPSTNYHAIPQSGYFMWSDNDLEVPVYIDQMQVAFDIQNISAQDVQSTCEYTGEEAWRCFFAMSVLKNLRTPTFIVQSSYDWWELNEIFFVNDPASTNCAFYGPTTCSMSQINEATNFSNTMLGSLHTGLSSNTEFIQGAFVTSCWSHCRSVFDSSWNGAHDRILNVTAAEAVDRWYRGTSKSTFFFDCSYTTNAECNPTCMPNFSIETGDFFGQICSAH